MVCSFDGKRMFLWRAVDDEGEVLDLVVQRRRDTAAALVLLKRLLRNQSVEPERIVTDGLRSYPAALEELAWVICIHPADYGRTIGRRIPTCRSDGESGSSSCSNLKPQPSAFAPLTPRSTTPSTPNVISSAVPPFAAFAPRPPPLGRRPQLRTSMHWASHGQRRLS